MQFRGITGKLTKALAIVVVLIVLGVFFFLVSGCTDDEPTIIVIDDSHGATLRAIGEYEKICVDSGGEFDGICYYPEPMKMEDSPYGKCMLADWPDEKNKPEDCMDAE